MLGVDGLREIACARFSLPLADVKHQILDRVSIWREGPAGMTYLWCWWKSRDLARYQCDQGRAREQGLLLSLRFPQGWSIAERCE